MKLILRTFANVIAFTQVAFDAAFPVAVPVLVVVVVFVVDVVFVAVGFVVALPSWLTVLNYYS